MDRTCKNCRWFREGVERKEKSWFGTDIIKEPDTCGYLNGMKVAEARVFNVPTAFSFVGSVPYPVSHNQVEGPCKAHGIFWEQKELY